MPIDPDTTHSDSARFWDAWADEYDEEHRDLDPGAAVEFLLQLAGGGPALELAVGTGRVALPLAARGIAVTGLDIAPRMLERLHEKRGSLPVTTVVSDMTTFVTDTRFPLVYCVFSGFFFLKSQEAQLDCLTRVAAALERGGRFVLEAFNPSARNLLTQRQQLAIRSLDDDAVRLSATMNDPAEQRVVFHELRLSEGGIRLRPLHARYAWPSEVDLMARIAGLRLVTRAGGWDGSPFEAASHNHVSVYELAP